ncbi:MAG: HAD family phosphatase [Candidatus Parcubacteria bacterium]|nr:HAD family phosphatase [Candidatus Parcubacteria bacterium]
MIKAVIFDQDGVIVDSEKINVASALYAFAKLGVQIDEADKKMIIGIHPTDYKNTLLAKYNIDFDEYNKIKREYYYQELDKVEFFSKTVAIIRKLQEENIPLGLVTSSKRSTTEKMMAKAGLAGVFKALICFEDCEQRKPAPDCYLRAAEKLGFEPQECLAVEDSYPGLIAAKASGATCFVIPNEATKDQDFSQADKIIDYDTELDFSLFAEVLGLK